MPNPNDLKGETLRELRDALISAFPTTAELRQMVRFTLDEVPDALMGEGNLKNQVFQLIEWAQSRGQLEDVLNGAYREKPDNPKLQAFLKRYSSEYDFKLQVTNLRRKHLLVPKRNVHFMGRDNELNNLHTDFVSGGGAAISQAVSGLGGIGKTSLAIEYAWRFADDYEYVIWLRVDSATSVQEGYVQLTRVLDLPENKNNKRSIVVAAARHWLSAQQNALLVLDNADYDDGYNPTELRSLLPDPGPKHWLITSRNDDVLEFLRVRHPLSLKTWSPDQALAYLIQRVARKENSLSGVEREAAGELAYELGYLPLALEQAAAYIVKHRSKFTTYLTMFRNQKITWLEKSQPNAGEYERSVATTWNISFKAVARKFSASADLLNACAFLSPDPIPKELIIRGCEEISNAVRDRFTACGKDEAAVEAVYDELLRPLLHYSLIEKDTENGTFSLHRLVQAVIRAEVGNEKQQTGKERAINMCNTAFPDVEDSNLPLCERLLAQSRAAAEEVESIGLVSAKAGRFLNQLAHYLEKRGFYQQALAYCEASCRVYKAVLPEGDPNIALYLNNLAYLYRTQERYSEAEPLYKEALSLYRSSLPEGHPDIARSLNNLAFLYNVQKRYSEAEQLYQEALTIRRAAVPIDYSEIALSLNNLAYLYDSQGRYTDAEVLFKEALNLRRAALPGGHSDIAQALNNLASLYNTQERYSEAKPLFEEALRLYRSSLPEGHPDIARSLNNLASLYEYQERYVEAEPLYDEAVNIMQKTLGNDHHETQIVVRNYHRFLKAKRTRETHP